MEDLVSRHYEPMWIAALPDGRDSIEEPEKDSIYFELDGVWYYGAPFTLEVPTGERNAMDGLLKMLATARRSPVVIVDEAKEKAYLEAPLSKRAKAKFNNSRATNDDE
jgi:hypothetical protein